ncbi:hypothetical protein [Gorillibacterium timonense]|uniref:hypothetical protein n=1 Tax=Gorillibacterium timonense TaxID=1689269 RepID=UPI00071DCD3C|nr:hypothetical protein [Gorillibacterium timonense]
MKRTLLCVLIAAFAMSGAPKSAEAVAELTPTVQAAFEKLAAGADPQTAGKLRSRYKEYAQEQEKERAADGEIKAVRSKADEARLSVNKRMKEWDAEKLARLEKQAKELKEKRQPLFDSYTRLNQQLSLAKSLKSKPAIALAQAQVDALKIPVQLAREEIRRKDKEWKDAKDARTAHLKKVRAVLAETEPLGLKLKNERSSATAAGKIVTAEMKVFSAAVRKADGSGALASLNRLVPAARDTVSIKSRILELERKKAAVIERASALLPAQ